MVQQHHTLWNVSEQHQFVVSIKTDRVSCLLTVAIGFELSFSEIYSPFL
jgi:hypothetical protein